MCAKIISCSRNRGRNGLSSSLESSSREMRASGYPRTHSLPYCGAKLESRRHHASAVQHLFLFHGMIGAQIFYMHTQNWNRKSSPVKKSPTVPASLPRRRESHERVGERSSDRDGSHARPPSSPRSKLDNFLAPSSSRFESDNDQATPVATEEF